MLRRGDDSAFQNFSKVMDHENAEIKTDFLQCLETNMSLHLHTMSFLDDPADVVHASAISHFWRHFGEQYKKIACNHLNYQNLFFVLVDIYRSSYQHMLCTSLGRPLFPAFNIELVEPDRKLLLKQYPKNLSSVLQSSPSNEIPDMRRIEEEMLW